MFQSHSNPLINMASEQLSFKVEESVQWHYVLLFYYRDSSSQIAKSASKKIETMHCSSIRRWECKILLANPIFLLFYLYIYSNKSFRCDWILECELILWKTCLHSLIKLYESRLKCKMLLLFYLFIGGGLDDPSSRREAMSQHLSISSR